VILKSLLELDLNKTVADHHTLWSTTSLVHEF
jgi:hypothetical protein